MKRPIEAKQVSVNKTTVEISRITVDKRSMTIAIYQQLPREQLVDWRTGTLRGLPWGRVNRCHECSERRHHHVLWQDDRLLKHAVVYQDMNMIVHHLEEWRAITVPVGEAWKVANDRARQAIFCRLAEGITLGTRPCSDGRVVTTYGGRPTTVDVLLYGTWWKGVTFPYSMIVRGLDANATAYAADARRKYYMEHVAQEFPGLNSAEVTEEYVTSALAHAREQDAKLRGYYERWNRRYEELTGLDQLFIAG